MIVGQTIPYSRKDGSFTSAEREGAMVAHHELIRAALAADPVQGVHFFLSGTPDDQLPIALLKSEFPTKIIAVHRLATLMQVCETHRHVFPVALESLPLLAAARLNPACGRFPVSGIVHSISSHASTLFYLGLSLLGESYDRVVATSEAGRQAINVILEEFSELIARRMNCRARSRMPVVKIPFGVDETFLRPIEQGAAREQAGLPQHKAILLYLGRITEEYKADLEPLLVALQQLHEKHSNVLLVIAGSDKDGRYTYHLQQLSAALGVHDHVLFKTNFPHALKPWLYSSADIFVSPVDNIQETFGLAVLEASACGVPVVASNWSGYRDLVLHGTTGFLVPTYWDSRFAAALSDSAPLRNQVKVTHELAQHTIVEVASLAKYLEVLLTTSELRRSMGARARERVLHEFRWSQILSCYIAMWEEQWEELCSQPRQAYTHLDLNEIYRHFASHELSPEITLQGSRPAREMLHDRSPIRGAHMQFHEIRSMCEKPQSLQQIEDQPCGCQPGSVAFLWKKGFLQLSSGPASKD